MKNTLKVLGIIALVALIGFSMVSCSDDEEETATGDGKDDGGTINISDTTIIGTWKGDGTNGTLVITASSITTSDTSGGAFDVAEEINTYTSYGSIVTKDNSIQLERDGLDGKAYDPIYDYTLSGTTLTLKDHSTAKTTFEGTKQ